MKYQEEIEKLYQVVDNSEVENTDEYVYIEEEIEQVWGEEPGEIALCVLSAINCGEFKHLSELEGICENIVRSLDFVIETQDYPVDAAKKMLKRRSIGVGITNLAYYFAKNDASYDSEKALYLIDELMEYVQYYLIKASIVLAKEFGPCDWFNRTKYSKGILPIDTYTKDVDNIIKRPLSLDWETLRADVLKYGMRNSTLTALMPCESSSLISNSTNGIEPVRSLVTAKKSKQGVLKMVVPEINKLKNKYSIAFSFDNRAMNNIVAIIQKWVDQGISVNHYYDFAKDAGNLSLSEIAKDILYFYKMGGKQLYYSNTNDHKTDKFFDDEKKEDNKPEELYEIDDAGCESGACNV
jgi:ribonucleoside-diphosphate reductase alpha chain